MTDDELKELVASLAIAQKETDKQLKETDQQIKETNQQLKETDKQLKETDRKVQKVSELFGNVSQNQGDIAEDFFFNSLALDNHLGSISFDDITRGMFKHRGKIQEEYDLFLTNGDSIAIIEVKYKAHLRDVDKLKRKFNHFKRLFPIYQDYKLYGAMASFYFNEEVRQALLNEGFFVLERSGHVIHSENGDYLKVA